MKILQITAGAAGMYCGSCLRDNALASELMARGHDVLLLPLYTPTLTDEPNVSQHRVFFGGISVYLQQYLALFRKTPFLLDRLWDSPWLINAVSGRGVSNSPRMLGELTVSTLKGEAGFQRKEIRKLIGWLQHETPPDIVNLPNSLLISLAGPIHKALDRPVCCTLQGEDLFLDGLQEPYRSSALDLIRARVSSVDAFLAVSNFHAESMSQRLSIPKHKMHVVPLGINLRNFSPRSSPRSSPFTIGYFARIAPEKGLHLLCQAYRLLRLEKGLPKARLEVAGYLGSEHKTYLNEIAQQMKNSGLSGEFYYHGSLDLKGKVQFLQNLDVLSVPATYDEPKGLSLLEAMASGVPVVQPRRGAFIEILNQTGGGILVDPDRADRLADGILSIFKDPSLAAELSRNGIQGVHKHYGVAKMADQAMEVYDTLVASMANKR